MKKCSLLRRLLYTLNKNKESSSELTKNHGTIQELTMPAG